MKGNTKTKKQLLLEMEELRTRLDTTEWSLKEAKEVLQAKITEHKRAEEALEKSSNQISATLASISDGFFVLDNELVITYFNQAAELLLGRKSGEVLGRKLSEAFPEAKGSIFGEKYTWAVKEKKAFSFETYFGIKPYENWYDVRVYPHENGISVFFQVTTKRKQAEEKLKQAAEEWEVTFDSIKDLVSIHDKDFKIVKANKAFVDTLGLESGEVIGRKCYEVIHGTEEPWLNCPHKQTMGSKTPVTEEFWEPRLGIYLQVSSSPIFNDRNEVLGTVHIAKDITERKRAEEALEVSNRFLQIINKQMEMTPLLKEFLVEIRNLTGCSAAGVRLLDDAGNIPYQAYEGFSQEFYQKESPLSIKSDQCMCINVIKGEIDPALPFYTAGGSFYINATSRFLATVSEKEKGKTRNECNRIGFESVALVPIPIGDGIHGLIHVADPRENMVPLEMVELLERVSMQLGTGIHRVRAEEALQKAHNELEIRVQERTAELAKANEELQAEIIERKRAEELLTGSENRLRNLSSQLLTVQENERKRVARELHDGIGQLLTAIKFKVEDSFKKEGNNKDKEMEKALETVIPLIQESIEEVRRIQMDLRPSILDDLGILATIGWFTREFQKVYSHISVEKQISVEENEIPDSLKTPLFRVMQEAMNNVAKHSKADLARLSLGKTGEKIELSIEDNGMGFDPEKTKQGLGLTSMRERTELSGGTLEIESTPGKGTIISALWAL